VKKTKKTYEVAVEWSVCGTVKIEAKSLEEAMKAAEELTPTDVEGPCYIDGSWEVNEEMSADLNLEIDEDQE
jgi:hypothetical protein